MFNVLFVLLLSGSVLTAAPLIGLKTTLPCAWENMIVRHKWDVIPDNWVTLGHPPDVTTIDFYIALKPNRDHALIDALQEVTSPDTQSTYGAHLSREQVADLVTPHLDTIELVGTWLEYKGVPPSSISTSHGGGWLTVTGVPMSQANAILGASYQLYYHSRTNDTILRTVGYALPTVLHTHVRTIVPTTAFTSSRVLQNMPRNQPGGVVAAEAGNVTTGEPTNALSRRDTFITPSVLRSMYDTEQFIPSGRVQNPFGIVGFENQFPSRTDMSDFMRRYRSDAGPPNLDIQTINSNPGSTMMLSQEANLGVQYTTALVFPTPVIYYMGITKGVGWVGPGDRYTEWLDYMAAKTSVPPTISMSYGLTSESCITLEYAVSMGELFGQLGARGVSILVANGDGGVGAGRCENAQLHTNFPASCPLATSVGGTVGGMTSKTREVANVNSGGGFSIFFSHQDQDSDRNFQAKDVKAFLQSIGGKYTGKYNPLGRGVPDIALQSWYYKVFLDREGYLMDGTSSATHTAAAIFSQLNDYRMTKKMRPLGWLNTWLYGLGYMGMNGIASENNPGCGTEGFATIGGWDPVTALGSLDFYLLQAAVDHEHLKLGDGAPPPARP